MFLTLGAVFPVFALIVIGWVAGRRRLLPASAVDALNGFVVKLALPVLLFQFVAEADWRTVWQPGFVAASGGAVALVFVATLYLSRQRLGDASVEGLAAAYSNTAFMGIPICQGLFGATGVAAGVIASLLTVCLLFACAAMLLEYERHRDRGLIQAAGGVAVGLLRNPIVVAPLAGGLWALGGFALPQPVSHLAILLGGAASPVALVTIGLFCAETPANGAGLRGPVVPLVLLKLVGQPLATFALVRLLGVPHPWDSAAILLAALPTGTGPFMLAKLYDREAGAIARVILVTTAASAVTVSLLALVLGGG